MGKPKTFERIIAKSRDEVETRIKLCNQDGHFQQVAFSVNGNCLTQVCFNCMHVCSDFPYR